MYNLCIQGVAVAPNNGGESGTAQHCVSMDTAGAWDDVLCSTQVVTITCWSVQSCAFFFSAALRVREGGQRLRHRDLRLPRH